MAQEVIIVGGGVAGISAAIEALDKGWRPIIFEKASKLGGRVTSLYARDAKKKIDIGQHVLSNSNKETKRLLSKIGSLEKVRFQRRLKINFKLDSASDLLFKSWPLPAPAHFFLPLILSPAISSNDKKVIFKWIVNFKKLSGKKLRKLTVSEWLAKIGDSSFLRKLIWEPLTIAILNTPIDQASAYLLYRVLNKAFLSSYFNSGLGLPVDYLDQIFGNPAHGYIARNGGSVYLRSEVKQLIPSGNTIQAIQTNKKKIFETPCLILAIPPSGLLRFADLFSTNGELSSNLKRFEFAPIITINLWFKTSINTELPTAFINSPIQWLFRLPDSDHKQGLYGYTVVMSAAIREARLDQQELIQLVEKEFEHFFGKNIHRDLELEKFKIIKEKRATIFQTPQSLELRSKIGTRYSNVHLAGDWINTELPATIESAVVSGKKAVNNLISN